MWASNPEGFKLEHAMLGVRAGVIGGELRGDSEPAAAVGGERPHPTIVLERDHETVPLGTMLKWSRSGPYMS